VGPAHRRLDAADFAVLEIDDRLVVRDRLVALERPLDVGLELQARHDLGVQPGSNTR